LSAGNSKLQVPLCGRGQKPTSFSLIWGLEMSGCEVSQGGWWCWMTQNLDFLFACLALGSRSWCYREMKKGSTCSTCPGAVLKLGAV
jgi:hypothetical protein